MHRLLRTAARFVLPVICLCFALTACGSRAFIMHALPRVIERQGQALPDDSLSGRQAEAQALKTCFANKTAPVPTVDCYLPAFSGHIGQRWSVGFADQEDLHNPADHGGADATCGPISFSYAVASGDASALTVASIPSVGSCPITAPKAAPGAPAIITTSANVRPGQPIKGQTIKIEFTGSSTVTDPSDGFNGAPATFNFDVVIHVGSSIPKAVSWRSA